jgi:hypothetical protein
MIDIDKIEAAAWHDKYLDTVHVLRPATVLEMVATIRKQREVMQQALEALEGADEIDCDMRDAIKALEEALK